MLDACQGLEAHQFPSSALMASLFGRLTGERGERRVEGERGERLRRPRAMRVGTCLISFEDGGNSGPLLAHLGGYCGGGGR